MSIRRLLGAAAAVVGLAAAAAPGAFSQDPVCEWAGTPCKLSVGLDDARVIDPVVAPNGQRVVLIHLGENGPVELYSAPLTGGSPPVRLSGPGEQSGFVAAEKLLVYGLGRPVDYRARQATFDELGTPLFDMTASTTTLTQAGRELLEAVLLDLALRVEAELALDANLDPEALAVEPVLVALVEAAHGPVALKHVLQGPPPGRVDP